MEKAHQKEAEIFVFRTIRLTQQLSVINRPYTKTSRLSARWEKVFRAEKVAENNWRSDTLQQSFVFRLRGILPRQWLKKKQERKARKGSEQAHVVKDYYQPS